ncbi:MAG: hypothetical protein JST13_15065, partial [Bacteroidetes bacterium]|nr:hypothetical protein [Bacteroidota bacterium]
NTANKLKAYLSTFICEKAYLQFNKPYYIAGDTIYFKSYVTEGEKHQLSDLSKVLYVELINQGNLIIQSIKLQLDSGISWGDFVLEDSLPAGTYRIRAYTRWMLNNNMNGLFEKPISIGALREKRIMKNNIFQHTNIVNKIDIQFFPEGGELVEDIRQKIAFKVINESGLGISVKGILLNNDNDTICSFQTEHNGMGYFYLLPLNGKTYKAIIIAEDGSRTMVYLPKPTISGIVLHIDNDSASRAFVTITSNKSYYKLNRDRNFFLIIYSGGKVVALTINLDSTIINFAIVKQKFQTGIAVITLFSPEGEPLCERLLFIKKNDQLALNIETDKAQYSKRDKVIVRLKTLFQGDTTVSGHFSISVIDENKIPVN